MSQTGRSKVKGLINQFNTQGSQTQRTGQSASQRSKTSRKPQRAQDTPTQQTEQSDSQDSEQIPQPRNENLSSAAQSPPATKKSKKKKRRLPNQDSDSSSATVSSEDTGNADDSDAPSATQTSQQQSRSQTTLGSDPKSPATKSVVSYLTREELERLLPSYLDNSGHRQKVMDAWDNYQASGRQLNSVPQLIDIAFSGQANKDSVIAATKQRVKQNNAEATPALEDAQSVATVYRADSRQPVDLVAAGGFHGFGGSMSIEHAKSWVTNVWNGFKRQEKAAWLQNWKATTSDASEQVVFVATGATESQKAGTEYKVNIPLQIPETGVPGVTPTIIYDGDTLEDSTVIAVAGRGEVVFLTGVASEYIQVWDATSSEYQDIA